MEITELWLHAGYPMFIIYIICIRVCWATNWCQHIRIRNKMKFITKTKKVIQILTEVIIYYLFDLFRRTKMIVKQNNVKNYRDEVSANSMNWTRAANEIVVIKNISVILFIFDKWFCLLNLKLCKINKQWMNEKLGLVNTA